MPIKHSRSRNSRNKKSRSKTKTAKSRTSRPSIRRSRSKTRASEVSKVAATVDLRTQSSSMPRTSQPVVMVLRTAHDQNMAKTYTMAALRKHLFSWMKLALSVRHNSSAEQFVRTAMTVDRYMLDASCTDVREFIKSAGDQCMQLLQIYPSVVAGSSVQAVATIVQRDMLTAFEGRFRL